MNNQDFLSSVQARHFPAELEGTASVEGAASSALKGTFQSCASVASVAASRPSPHSDAVVSSRASARPMLSRACFDARCQG